MREELRGLRRTVAHLYHFILSQHAESVIAFTVNSLSISSNCRFIPCWKEFPTVFNKIASTKDDFKSDVQEQRDQKAVQGDYFDGDDV